MHAKRNFFSLFSSLFGDGIRRNILSPKCSRLPSFSSSLQGQWHFHGMPQQKKESGGIRTTGSSRHAGHKSERVPQRRRHKNQPACRRYRYEESVSCQCVSGTHVPFRQRLGLRFFFPSLRDRSKQASDGIPCSLTRSASRGAFRRELSALLDCRLLWRRENQFNRLHDELKQLRINASAHR